ncbi:putative nuclease HARBI1 [Ischnura elegans]|uniref:putative nuclease HARBI1 n=1 Tax=Ischnura elegans TaxID=197161 RepID=UPI001ED89EF8|nr:putative nuclease HARBI1 [Ischnura elegans]
MDGKGKAVEQGESKNFVEIEREDELERAETNNHRHATDNLFMEKKAITMIVLIEMQGFAKRQVQQQEVVIGELLGVSTSSVCRIIKKVSLHIAMLSEEFINFPSGREELNRLKEEFFAIARFPGIIGAIDCTHIPITSPGGGNAELFRNRKSYFSINVQAVCSPTLKLTNLVARWPGSVHDSTIFNNSFLRAKFESGEIPDGYLLGDGGYPCKPYLLTPLLHPVSRGERNYNLAHVRSRNPIERCFGVLKRRFPCLSIGLRTKTNTSLIIIVATGVLHNISILFKEEEPLHDANVNPHPYDEVNQPMAEGNDRATGAAVRRAIINGIFS